jgi:phosphohistidine swiveling domain-containing protein
MPLGSPPAAEQGERLDASAEAFATPTLEASDEGQRERALALCAELVRQGRLPVDEALLARIARIDEATPLSAPALGQVAELVRRLPAGELAEPGAGDPVAALFHGARARPVRRLAARLLDASGQRPSLTWLGERIGREAAAFLAPYLEHSGATHQDLIHLSPAAGRPPAPLEGLRRAERTLGPELLREVIGRLGWSRLSCGLSARPRVGLEVGGSFPFVLSPAQARLVAGASEAQVAWRRNLVIAHGGPPDDEAGGAPDEVVQRFRSYNLTHAALLDEILAVAPLDRDKAERILGLMDRAVADFEALFGASSEDARRAGAVYRRLRQAVARNLAQDGPRGALSAETVRRMQMFEDPQRLEDVTTVHGLKRYLHQQGLRLAFQLFRTPSGANRTVDLLVTGEREVLRCEQVIRYLEFEPTEPAGDARLPFAISLLAEAFGRQLLLGRKLPWVTVLGYGNELQVYVHYRNHPAFLRIDLSPPLRGGMIDLEYFAVSQYEMDQHPDLSLQGMERVLRELDLDVSKDGFRLHARYDKERAADLGDIVDKARALFDLLPHLMDVDWVIGDLDYPAGARAEVAADWAGFFRRWGAIPSAEALSSSRRKVVAAIEPDAAGPREVAWDGRGPYRDRFSGKPPEGFAEKLRGELERLGLGELAGAAPATRGAWGQRLLETAVLRPLAEAEARGEVRETASGIEPVPAELFQREHEAVRLAEILDQGGPALARAARMASLVRGVERQARFRTTGSVQGYAVQAASLPTAPRPVGLFVLRDAQGMVRLALAAGGGVLYRARGGAGEPWRRPDELEVAALARSLRASNYLGAGPDGAAASPGDDPGELAERLSAFSAAPVPRLSSGERVIPATVAAPGRATGFAFFHTAGRRPVDFEGAVLLSGAVRPEDAPWLRHAAGIVSTGGGILSHVGLIALELEKPAVIVDGHWSTAPSGAEVLLYRRPEWREEESARGRYLVVCRRELREAEETLEQGDLVAVDGDGGGLVVLGHDPQALALHQDLQQLQAASTALASTRSDVEILVCRGRLIRATHQLEKLLARLDRPALARHAARELLAHSRAPLAPEGRGGRSRLLAALLRNPACGTEARLTAAGRLHELRARFEAASRTALEDLPNLENPAEAVFARLGVRRMGETLADALDLVRAHGLDAAGPGDAGPVDVACRRRLSELRDSIAARVEAARGPPGERWRLRHLIPRLEQIGRVLGLDGTAPAHADLAVRLRLGDEARLRELGPRRILGGADGGIELGPLVGGKAAHLGEIVRVLGEAAVPAWFTVADAAFREALAMPAPLQALEALGLDRGGSLGAGIASAAAHPGWDSRRRAGAIRELWQATPLPEGLGEEIAAAYRGLASAPGEEPAVAIRSSGREEDAEAAAWAGQFDTFLFVRGAGPLLQHLKLAWAGFWTERAIEQRRLLGAAPLSGGGGVVVQRMVDSRASGVLHTICAATGQLREMVVNAGLGLGEGIVSGTVEVDTILVSKEGDLRSGDLRLRYRVGDKREQVVRDEERGSGTRRRGTRYHQRLRPALEYVELCELVGAAARLEEALLEPLDIEFAIEGRDLRILQARPVSIFDAAWRETLAHHPLPAAGAPRGEEAP